MPIILLATVLTLSALYAPQPLLPVLVREFGITREAAAFLTTVSFIPLSLAPLVYGYVLEAVPPRRVLRVAVALLALSEVVFALSHSYPLLVGLRLFQGLLIPAILTALMTYLSRASAHARIQRALAIYVAATILGGLLGRVVSGLLATWFGWRVSFAVLAVSLLLCFVLLARLPGKSDLSLVRPTPGAIREVLARPGFLHLYLVIFCLFLVFAAIMNFIPFRLTEISDQATELRIGLMYCGYAMGIVTSLNAVRIGRKIGGEPRAVLLGLAGLLAALLLMAAPQVEVLFLDMFFFCAAMFLVHATASGLLNRLAASHKGIVNGLYVAFYYGGGTVGSYLPGFIYRQHGWSAFLGGLAAVTALAIVLALGCRSLSLEE